MESLASIKSLDLELELIMVFQLGFKSAKSVSWAHFEIIYSFIAYFFQSPNIYLFLSHIEFHSWEKRLKVHDDFLFSIKNEKQKMSEMINFYKK